jgi:hypothetical protein
MRAAFVLVILAVFALAAACGQPTVDACEGFKDSLLALECVPDDYDVGINCEEYADYPCDASAYFECLEDTYTCDEGGNLQYDLTACAGLTEC